ncbi:DUF5695 domain-containing protein [Paenibacillus medicaginis]|uniref:DUF5695 domain-containing protein n=1 Tax=Paenibacillus medicaginis TaxID=1470560 RepID=A0ABV5BY44_9BACL
MKWKMILTAFFVLTAASMCLKMQTAAAYELANDKLTIQTGQHGEISSIRIKGDAFPTEYVMNATVSPEQNTADHQWLGELMFTYRLDGGSWTKAWTNKSADVRKITSSGNLVTVTYENSGNAEGIRNFKVIETYSAEPDGSVRWNIEVQNTSGKKLEIGDFGLPLPFNEQWTYGDAIYETRVVTHSFVGNNGSYVTAGRPSGVGSYLMMIPDAATGAGFEYQDRWRDEEHPGSKWAWNPANEGKWIEGLNVFYIHSNVIKSTNRGYLPNTSLTLNAGENRNYGFKFLAVKEEQDMKNKLYEENLLDVTVVPGMIVPTNQKAKVDLRTKQAINKVTYPDGTVIPLTESKAGGHNIYELQLTKLGPNNITVEYGNGSKTVLQFYAIEPVDQALQRHSTFMVEKTQWNVPGDLRDKVFDDWMMNTKSKRNVFNGYWGWGDDWGLTHGQFLAEKNVLTPVAREVQAVDDYLETAIWTNLMNGHHEDYLIHDFLMPEPNDTPTYRGYAYPHVYNTYFSMYKIAKEYPNLVTYKHPKETYLLRAYNIFKALYEGPVAYNWETGLMGELTTPDIIQALEEEGFVDEASDLKEKMDRKFNNFKNTKYPYGSEYSYDNTGEEAVYTLAKMKANAGEEESKSLEMMGKINAKTRASRGHMPVWYYYADPVTITGENWFNFQYTTSLAGYAMDDWIRYHESNRREEQQRLSYAAKIANVGAINSGQISSDPANIGAVAWTYQAEKGNNGTNGTGGGRNIPLLNGWRGMSGEADLGLFGALHTLSADVAVDPIFGLTGYGAEVSESGDVYTVKPLDGLYKRINLITEKLYMELSKDQFTEAKLSASKDYVWFQLKNQTGQAHTTYVTFEGLEKGTYLVKVNGQTKGKFNAYAPVNKLKLEIGTAASYTVELTPTTPDPNQAPAVNAGQDFTVKLPDPVVLKGTAEDDGLPQGKVTSEWSLVDGPQGANVTFASKTSLRTKVNVSAPGTYQFKLTANDSLLSAEDIVSVVVESAAPLPEQLALYKLDETSGTVAADSSGSGNAASVKGTAAWAAGIKGNAVSLNGRDSYVQLPAGIVSRAQQLTVSGWVKASSLSDYMRIFDFGSGTNEYMFLTPKAGNRMLFAITVNGNGAGQEQTITGPVLPTGVWKHVAVTLNGSTGILYVDGREVGRNTSMTLNPTSLGQTKNNYIGKSQYPDPYLNGLVDDFRIYSRALSAAEVQGLATATAQSLLPMGDITALKEVSVTTSAGIKPELPSVVEATYGEGEGSSKWVDVQWEDIDPALYAAPGSFEVKGTVEGTLLQAIARVTVIEAGAEVQMESPDNELNLAAPVPPVTSDLPVSPISSGKSAGNP